jgi:hypothetical protein
MTRSTRLQTAALFRILASSLGGILIIPKVLHANATMLVTLSLLSLAGVCLPDSHFLLKTSFEMSEN